VTLAVLLPVHVAVEGSDKTGVQLGVVFAEGARQQTLHISTGHLLIPVRI
jgi:hypothetical protein